jgi:hypothetical protein
MAESDFYMPEYWPANRLIGVLEHVLVEAKQIIGQLKNAQIESLEAGKITGQLSNEQIKELAAAKIAGQLQDSQIKELSAAKLLGQLKTVQIEDGAITAAKVAANAITAEKILAESITASKIAAGAISTEKLAAASVTAEKLSVKELSAITVNAGTIEAGTFKGVTFETKNGRTVLNNEGLNLIAPKIGESGATNRIEWYKEKLKGTLVAELVSYTSESGGTTFVRLQANTEEEAGVSKVTVGASHPTVAEKNKEANLILEATKTLTKIVAEVGAVTKTIFDTEEKSSFLQLTEVVKRKINFGEGTIVYAKGNTLSNVLEVEHGLGSAVKFLVATEVGAPGAGGESSVNSWEPVGATKFKIKSWKATAATEEQKRKFTWIAVV